MFEIFGVGVFLYTFLAEPIDKFPDVKRLEALVVK